MNVHLPSDLLRPYVHSYRIVESVHGQVNRVLPATSLVMAFRYRGRVSYEANHIKSDLSTMVISGLRKSGRLMNYEKATSNIVVLFTETGASAFIKEPLHELFEKSVSLDNLSGYRDITQLEDKLAEANNDQQRIRLIEQFLLIRLQYIKPDGLTNHALRHIHASNGSLRIKELASLLCISQDAFGKRFRKVVGVAPKQFANIIRMKSIISRSEMKAHRLNELAFNAGYFDQSHFNKDFKTFTGLTPTDFSRSPVFW